ncbi:MAG TPA: MBL fold metallo-hydrolase [Acidimicrobiales bacterium]
MSLVFPDDDPIVFDIGTGLRFFGDSQPQDGSFRGTALVSHLHWDHIQGLPFFVPVLRPGAEFTLFGPGQDGGKSMGEAFDFFMRDPYFPVTVAQLPSDIRFVDAEPGTFMVGKAEVLTRHIPHVGRTLGYRVTRNGASIAYLSDHQQPYDGSFGITDSALELIDGADLVIHDAQYTAEEFALKATWGHCTVEYAMRVAKEAGAKRLALFHHDPSRDDDALDETARCATAFGEKHGIEILTAYEGLTLELGT